MSTFVSADLIFLFPPAPIRFENWSTPRWRTSMHVHDVMPIYRKISATIIPENHNHT